MNHDEDAVFFYGHADLLGNMTQGDLTVSSLLNVFSLGWEAGWDGVEGTNWEGELNCGLQVHANGRFRQLLVASGLGSLPLKWPRVACAMR